MKWNYANGYILDGQGKMVCVLPDNPDPSLIKILTSVPEILNTMLFFVVNIEGNSFKAKKCYNKFKKLVDELDIELPKTLEDEGD